MYVNDNNLLRKNKENSDKGTLFSGVNDTRRIHGCCCNLRISRKFSVHFKNTSLSDETNEIKNITKITPYTCLHG